MVLEGTGGAFVWKHMGQLGFRVHTPLVDVIDLHGSTGCGARSRVIHRPLCRSSAVTVCVSSGALGSRKLYGRLCVCSRTTCSCMQLLALELKAEYVRAVARLKAPDWFRSSEAGPTLTDSRSQRSARMTPRKAGLRAAKGCFLNPVYWSLDATMPSPAAPALSLWDLRTRPW